jgi:hypothetical protein
MKRRRLLLLLVGLVVGYRLGTLAVYWSLRAMQRRDQAEALQRLSGAMRASRRAGERIAAEGLADQPGPAATARRLEIILEEQGRG